MPTKGRRASKRKRERWGRKLKRGLPIPTTVRPERPREKKEQSTLSIRPTFSQNTNKKAEVEGKESMEWGKRIVFLFGFRQGGSAGGGKQSRKKAEKTKGKTSKSRYQKDGKTRNNRTLASKSDRRMTSPHREYFTSRTKRKNGGGERSATQPGQTCHSSHRDGEE